MTTKQTFSPRDDDIDLRALLGTLLDHKWLIVAITSAFFVISVIYAVLATPIYQASAVVQVEQKTPSLPGLDDLSQTLGISTSEAVTEIQLITSRLVIGQAVANLKLDTESAPKHFPLIGCLPGATFRVKTAWRCRGAACRSKSLRLGWRAVGHLPARCST
jgi:tyrosine-protein kinase Etk/Wzc